MEIVKNMQDFFDNLEPKKFSMYLVAIICFIAMLTGGMAWYYFNTTNYYLEQIHTINELREKDIKDLLTMYQRTRAERKQVDAVLAQDPNFKIADYFDKLLNSLNLTQKNLTAKPSTIEREEYRERILTTTFTQMNMQELCTLLQSLEDTKRVFTKELKITRSKKSTDSIDVTLVIATLLPKASS